MSNIDFTGRVKKSFLDNGHFSKRKKKGGKELLGAYLLEAHSYDAGEGGAGCVQGCCHSRSGARGNHPFSGKETPPCKMVFIHSALISYGK